MSRSYKRTPVIKDKNKGAKRISNKAVRKYKGDVSNGNFYRKIFCSYDISDYSFMLTFEEYKERNETLGQDCSYIDWYKVYKMK